MSLNVNVSVIVILLPKSVVSLEGIISPNFFVRLSYCKSLSTKFILRQLVLSPTYLLANTL